jgi:hypothetical protein
MKLTKKKEKEMKYNGCEIKRSTTDGKKYTAVCNGKEIDFGASGYRIKPRHGCSVIHIAQRSAAIKSDPLSPNAFARALWSCKGTKSVSDKPFFGKIKLP